MLKITKGLNPYINKDVEDGISIYSDDEGNEYVRVKIGDEDFCITAHDYIKDGKQYFTWDEAMKIVKEMGLTMLTKKQVELYKAHHNEINSKLKEIGGEPLDNVYWSCCEYGSTNAWYYIGYNGILDFNHKSSGRRVRPVLVISY